jgi:hypothetical protein
MAAAVVEAILSFFSLQFCLGMGDDEKYLARLSRSNCWGRKKRGVCV